MSDNALRAEVIRLAHAKPELRKALVPLLKQAAGQWWGDDNPASPATPWGPAQSGDPIVPGVAFYSTAGHGGVRVSRPAAAKYLSPAAVKAIAESWGGYFWFEEDVAINVLFYERPEWLALLQRRGHLDTLGGLNGKELTPAHKAMLEKGLLRSFPRYFALKEQGDLQHLAPVKAGDTLSVVNPITFRDGFTLKAGDTFVAHEVTRARIKFLAPKHTLTALPAVYLLPYGKYADGDVVKV